jgi:hypothetical protein
MGVHRHDKPLQFLVAQKSCTNPPNAPQDMGMHSNETKKTGKKGRAEAVGRDSVGF